MDFHWLWGCRAVSIRLVPNCVYDNFPKLIIHVVEAFFVTRDHTSCICLKIKSKKMLNQVLGSLAATSTEFTSMTNGQHDLHLDRLIGHTCLLVVLFMCDIVLGTKAGPGVRCR